MKDYNLPRSSAAMVGGLALALIVIFPLASLALNLGPAQTSLRAGWAAALKSPSFWLSAAALLTVLFFVSAIIIDQYPCWIGVPNFD